MKIETHLFSLQRIVLAGGGQWVGVQQSMVEGQPALVLFNSEKTGSTLGLADDEFFTVNAVQEKIRLSDKAFEDAPVRISKRTIRNILESLETIKHILELSLERK